jgi:CRP-like cAMP-binding protein
MIPGTAKKGDMDAAPKKCFSVNRSELFTGVPSYVCEKVISRALLKDFVSGEVIYSVGDPIKQVLLLTDGRAKKSQFSESGREVILRLSVPGEVISERALMREGRHSSTALALQDCKVLAWDSAAFKAALESYPDLRWNVKLILESRLAELDCRFFEVSTGTASPRLANSLLHLLDHIGRRVDDHIEINVSQEALGQMTAMTPTSVCRLLNVWKRQGLVKLRKEIIEVHSVPLLLGLCNFR